MFLRLSDNREMRKDTISIKLPFSASGVNNESKEDFLLFIRRKWFRKVISVNINALRKTMAVINKLRYKDTLNIIIITIVFA